ncbi:MAG TPA: DoxX family protein [Gemmatimonadaceae bacterium]|jgi:putative oxidoreductase|nr:DoxX family protein [Gemmatimonadaceae bacterium]
MLDSDNARWRSLGMLVLRVIVGVVFILHGWMKVKMGIAGTTGFFSSVGIPFPMVVAWFSILAEVAGGAALILGILTLPVGLALVVDMCGAIFFVKRGGGIVGPKGAELELTLLAASLAIALVGPGTIALSEAFKRRSRSV